MSDAEWFVWFVAWLAFTVVGWFIGDYLLDKRYREIEREVRDG